MSDCVCQFCSQGVEIQQVAGQLHAEMTDARKLIVAHHRCMQYSSGLTQYKTPEFGGFDINEVEKEANRAKFLKCSLCKNTKNKAKQKGASCGCAVKSCRKTFHFPCAHEDLATITKRLVVTKNRDDDKGKYVLYRVFCSKDHEELFRQSLKEELRQNRISLNAQKKTDENMDNREPVEISSDEQNTTLMDIMSSPATHERHGDKVDDAIDDDSGSTQISSSLKKQRRKSEFLKPPPQRTKRVSQPPSVSLIEETSRDTSKAEVRDETDGQPPATGAGTVITTEATVHCSLLQENKSPNIPPASSDSTKLISDCFVSLENGIVLNGDSVLKLSSPARGIAVQGSPRTPSRAAGLSLVSSPAKKAQVQERTQTRTPLQADSIPVMQSCSPDLDSSKMEVQPVRSSPRHGKSAEGSTSLVKTSKTATSNPAVCSSSVSEKDSGECQSSQNDSVSRQLESLLTAKTQNNTSENMVSISQTGPKTSRKRKGSEASAVSVAHKKSQRNVADAVVAPEDAVTGSILLIPGDMEQFTSQESDVMKVVCKAMSVTEELVAVWQQVTLQTLPPQLLLIFVLELTKQLKSGDNDAVLELLFGGENMETRLDFLAQAQIFESISDKTALGEVYRAFWSALEKETKTLPMVQVLGHKNFFMLALDIGACKDSYKIMAHLKAYKGLYRWSEKTEVKPLHLPLEKRILADKMEALAMQIWLTKVTPVTEVTVLPAEEWLLDKAKLETCKEYLGLIEYLKARTHAAMEVQMDGESLQAVVPLLLFQPVNFTILSFYHYFQEVVCSFLSEHGFQRVMALVPTSNFYVCSYQDISMLMRRCSERDERESYSITACSTFCPETHTTNFVLLQIEAISSVAEVPEAIVPVLEAVLPIEQAEPSEPSKRGEPNEASKQGEPKEAIKDSNTLKKRRGRPPKRQTLPN